MERHEEDILRLNLRIKELISRNNSLETRNEELEIENRALLSENAHLRKANAGVQQFNVRYKTELEKEITQREQLYEANQKHKERYQLLLARFTDQSEKVKTLEHSLRAAASTRRINHVPVEIIGKVSDIGKNKEYEKRCQALQSRCDELQTDLTGAYAIIDDLEFELESIDYLEDENERLQQEVKRLRTKLRDQTPLPAGVATAATVETAAVADHIPSPDQVDGAMGEMKLTPAPDETTATDTDTDEDGRKIRRDELHKKLETLHGRQSAICPRP